jgi:hypothetical protein
MRGYLRCMYTMYRVEGSRSRVHSICVPTLAVRLGASMAMAITSQRSLGLDDGRRTLAIHVGALTCPGWCLSRRMGIQFVFGSLGLDDGLRTSVIQVGALTCPGWYLSRQDVHSVRVRRCED